ncbi:MAG: ABC transporter substrate-binding protein [Anaerolineae bacterium]|jgi:iron complex transport system substrate-binding protein|nr:ABC transporter substrate-binding protein [Anaerolineae bacterium]MBT7070834.1 ABC transporter substrate-binding protein [Anaerolineae bacterium]MBT7323716.1 ABC transporter substrate-binding protein [Anaerolineae bacterium]
MKKTIFFILTMLSLALLLGACAPENAPAVEAPAPEMMFFSDDMGNKLEFSEYPQAILSISASTTETLFAISAGEQLIGREDMSLYPEEALALPSIGSLWGDLPTEAILALEPDLVVAAEIISAEQVAALQELGLQVYWQANPTTYEELWENLRDFGALTGHIDETETLVADLDARVKAVQGKIMPLSYMPTVFYELDATDPANPWTTGSGTFIDYIINTAGGLNAASELQGDYTQISAEQLIAVNPQIILLGDALYGVTPESVAERAGWDAIIAVQEGAIYSIDPNILSVPGPRLVDGLEETAKLLHPGIWE